MRFSGVSANAIWNNAVRTLTGLGTAITQAGINATTLAASSSVDVQPAAGQFFDETVGVKTGAAATGATSINMWDGSTAVQIAATAAAALSPASANMVLNNARRMRITNSDGAVAATYVHSGILWQT